MSTVATLFVKLALNSEEYAAGLSRAASSTAAVAKEIGGGFTSAGQKMSLGLTAPLVGAGIAATNMAMDLQESQNAVNVVFGESAAIMDEYGKTVATTAGLSRAEFNQLGAVTGAFLKNVGYDTAGAAEETIKLTARASDMASIFNTDVATALNAIQSGLKGEFNPLEQFGVKLNAAAIEARAMEMGLADANGELSESAKAQAALALVMEQTEQFAGDFVNTSDGLANSMKIAKAQFTDAAAALGTQLLPIGLKIVEFVSALIEKLNALTPEQQKTILMVAGMVAAIGPLLMIVGNLITAFGVVSSAISSVAAVLTFPLIAIIIAVVAVIALLSAAWKNNWGDIRGKTQAAIETISATISMFLSNIRAWWAENGAAIMSNVSLVWDSIVAVFSSVFEIIKSLFQAFQAAFNGDWYAFGEKIREAWDTAWQLIIEVVETAWPVVKEFVETLIDNIVTFFEDTDWASVGKNIVTGIGAGLKSMISWLEEAARAVAKAALDAAKGFLGINSDSKAFAELGKYSALGFGHAFQDVMKFMQPKMVLEMLPSSTPVIGTIPEPRIDRRQARSLVVENVTINNGMDLQEFKAMLRSSLNG